MPFPIWALVIGALMITMALAGTLLKRLPVSASMLYLAVGYELGSAGWGLMSPNPRLMPGILETVAEIAVLISLFSVGLKIGAPITSRKWRLPLRLAFVSMTLTVALIAAVGYFCWRCRSARRYCSVASWRPPTRCWRPMSRSMTPRTVIAYVSA